MVLWRELEKMLADSSRRTALVVETNFLIASAIEEPLRSAGYRVIIATDVEEAVAILLADPVHLALIDFRLQHAEPEGLVAVLKQHCVPFIFCTAASAEEVYEHFPDAPVMEKPFSDKDLLAAVATLDLVAPPRSTPGVTPS